MANKQSYMASISVMRVTKNGHSFMYVT